MKHRIAGMNMDNMLGNKVKASRAVRKCRLSGCPTTLSVYNRSRYCFMHHSKLVYENKIEDNRFEENGEN